jgi:hypothetical protein
MPLSLPYIGITSLLLAIVFRWVSLMMKDCCTACVSLADLLPGSRAARVTLLK